MKCSNFDSQSFNIFTSQKLRFDKELKALVQLSANIGDNIGYLSKYLDIVFQYLNHNLVISSMTEFLLGYILKKSNLGPKEGMDKGSIDSMIVRWLL